MSSIFAEGWGASTMYSKRLLIGADSTQLGVFLFFYFLWFVMSAKKKNCHG